jgi:hypothetical protein
MTTWHSRVHRHVNHDKLTCIAVYLNIEKALESQLISVARSCALSPSDPSSEALRGVFSGLPQTSGSLFLRQPRGRGSIPARCTSSDIFHFLYLAKESPPAPCCWHVHRKLLFCQLSLYRTRAEGDEFAGVWRKCSDRAVKLMEPMCSFR